MADWKIGIRYEMLPGDGAVERFRHAARFGFDVIELPGRYLHDYRDDLEANLENLALPISSLSLGFRGSLASADAASRSECRESTKALLAFCAKIGAIGLVMPPILHMDNHADLDDDAQRDALLHEQLPELAAAAADEGVTLMLEPVNGMETDYMTTIEHGLQFCEAVNSPGLGLTIDFFHMQITELDAPTAIRRAGKWIRHVHVAENVRCEPGPGTLDFAPGFEALREIGYGGFVVVECRYLSGPPDDVLPCSASYLRGLVRNTNPH